MSDMECKAMEIAYQMSVDTEKRLRSEGNYVAALIVKKERDEYMRRLRGVVKVFDKKE